MNFFNRFKFFGGRVFKTGLAIYLTALLCNFFHLQAVFAVITAIVTIEPTASDSIKKGIVRFPASIIGAGISMTFTYLLGHGPMSYTLAATVTILVCYKLKLEAGILVAALTAVAMIPITHDHYFLAFAERLATTTIGLVVSSLVNLTILPPKFSSMISKKNTDIANQVAYLLELLGEELFEKKKYRIFTLSKQYQRVTKELDKAFLLCQYQRSDWKFHRHTTSELRHFTYEQRKLQIFQQLLYHIGNLLYVKVNQQSFTDSENALLNNAVKSLAASTRNMQKGINNQHYLIIEELDKRFWHLKEDLQEHSPKKYHHHFTSETIILYEILSIHDAMEELEYLQKQYKLNNASVAGTSLED